MVASLPVQAVRSARPRPFWSRWIARTPSTVAASTQAICHVVSVDALSAMVIRQLNGNSARRYCCSVMTLSASTAASLYTGITMSTTVVPVRRSSINVMR